MKKSLSKLLNEAKTMDYFCLLNPNQYANGFPLVFASGNEAVLWKDLSFELNENYFGFLSYDLKNDLFKGLESKHKDWQEFPQSTFFKAETLIKSDELLDDLNENQEKIPPLTFEAQVTKKEYITTVEVIREHILNGDVYELNFCIPFVAQNVELDTVAVYKKLNAISPTPFSSLLKIKDCWLICASPERYVKKEGQKVVSEPIKGTTARGKTKEEDKRLADALKNSEKERAENLMIVDLVRNDLNRCCKPTTVKVDELFGIYKFPQVHQMISTISGELEDENGIKELIENTFPMGSMTGAPKLKSMELIEQYESSKRGIYSGAVGYIDKNHDADFNVVIRSLYYNETTKTLSFIVGGAITYASDAEKEYEECLLKASAMIGCFK